MSLAELCLLALALSMDAFAVAVCIGLSTVRFSLRNAIIVGLYFGAFQAIMPLIGYFVGGVFAERVTAVDHWVVFVLLVFLGGKMIGGSLKKDDGIEKQASLAAAAMLPLAFATSIDALAAGVSFAFSRVGIVPAIVLIGTVTFVTSAFGVRLGGVVGIKFKSKAEILGGVILIALGVRALVQGI